MAAVHSARFAEEVRFPSNGPERALAAGMAGDERGFEHESEDVIATPTGTRLFALGRLEVVDGLIRVAVALAVPANTRLEVHVAPALAPLGCTGGAAVGATVPQVEHPARPAR